MKPACGAPALEDLPHMGPTAESHNFPNDHLFLQLWGFLLHVVLLQCPLERLLYPNTFPIFGTVVQPKHPTARLDSWHAHRMWSSYALGLFGVDLATPRLNVSNRDRPQIVAALTKWSPGPDFGFHAVEPFRLLGKDDVLAGILPSTTLSNRIAQFQSETRNGCDG
ncbi:uncharacterized protein PAC_17865 [Phialocephala subalpina]|uniref:Uncharacterized protein n=1 Tax=Phialocephala subalpina TaxID=576137 RepID=A0A1L7XSD6_9HELO|nr:uncharacterized protein PAC_17865 [Phialocephala subalpina]